MRDCHTVCGILISKIVTLGSPYTPWILATAKVWQIEVDDIEIKKTKIELTSIECQSSIEYI